jgi:hypothetical protein
MLVSIINVKLSVLKGKSRCKTLQKAAKYEAVRCQSRPIFQTTRTGLEFSPFLSGFLVNFRVGTKTKPPKFIDLRRFRRFYWLLWLSDQDSNLNRQNQNLQCYRYTIGQQNNKGAKLYKKLFWQIISFLLPGYFAARLSNHRQAQPGFFY